MPCRCQFSTKLSKSMQVEIRRLLSGESPMGIRISPVTTSQFDFPVSRGFCGSMTISQQRPLHRASRLTGTAPQSRYTGRASLHSRRLGRRLGLSNFGVHKVSILWLTASLLGNRVQSVLSVNNVGLHDWGKHTSVPSLFAVTSHVACLCRHIGKYLLNCQTKYDSKSALEVIRCHVIQ